MKNALYNFCKAAIFLAAFFCAFSRPALAQEKPWKNSTVAGAAQGYKPKIADDFYAAVNHDWLLSAKIPQGYSRIDSFIERDIEIGKELLGLMQNKALKGRDAQNVQNLYALFLDWEARKAGAGELKKIIGRVQNINTMAELCQYIASSDSLCNGTSLCDFYAGGDLKDFTKSALMVYAGGLTLGDSAEYKSLSQNGKNAKEFADAVSQFVLQKAGFNAQEAQKIIGLKYKFEAELAASMMTKEDWHSPGRFEKILNKRTIAELGALSPNFPLVQIMALRGMNKARRIYLAEPKWLQKINALFVQENFEQIKACVIDAIARQNAASLDKETYDFYQAALRKRNGIERAQSYQEDACDFVSNAVSVPLSKLYAKNCVDKSAKPRVAKLIRQTIAQYKKIIWAQDWLCAATKKKAAAKIGAVKIHVGCPALWDNWSALDIRSAAEGESFFSAVQKIKAFRIEQTNKRVNKVLGSGMWNAKVYQANAFYGYTNNSINIIAGIMGGAFFSPGMKDEELYATLGAVIGHELSHSFDASGSQFNKHGSMKNWWSEPDWEAFKKRSQKIADYFDGMNTLGSERQSGTAVQGEAAADIGGIKAMLELAKKNPDFDYDLFFKTYARLWACLCQKEFANFQLKIDNHPFAYLRVNATVQQFDEFYKTYGAKPGDGMYLAPKDRISIW